MKRTREQRVLEGLARIVGLAAGEASEFDVLKTVAETLGLEVAADGTTVVEDEEEEEHEEDEGLQQPSRKRAKPSAPGNASAAGAGKQAASASVDACLVGSDAEEAEEGGEEDGSDDSGGAVEEGVGQEEGDADSLLSIEPVRVEDPRTPDQVVDQESIVDGEQLFQWLIAPVDTETFEQAIWEQEPLLVSRPSNRTYFAGLLGKQDIDGLLRDHGLQYQFNIDVVHYRGQRGKAEQAAGERQNFNYNGDQPPPEDAAPEVADADVVWQRFGQGCSLRVLHPQRWSDPLCRLLARLESYLQCCVGCNAYLTPAGTQGFAPHFDDIDAYVLQVEGRKRWRLYAPSAVEHVLPRYSSRDFHPEELGPCVLDAVLEPGDMLYMPRGTVHQAESLPDSHSLHLTVSANQQRNWVTFLEEALPLALREAARQHVGLRQSLPQDFLDYMGVQHEAEGDEQGAEPDQRRLAFQEQAAALGDAVLAHLPLDAVADQFGAAFLADRLPPVLPARPAAAPAAAAGGAGGSGQLSKGSMVRLAMPGIARLTIDEEQAAGQEPVVLVHHCMANRRLQHAARRSAPDTDSSAGAGEAGAAGGGAKKHGKGEEQAAEAEHEEQAAGVLEFPLGCAEVIDILLSAGSGAPGSREAVALRELPEPEECDLSAVEVAQALADAGVLVVA